MITMMPLKQDLILCKDVLKNCLGLFFSDCGEQTYNYLDIVTLTPVADTSPGM